MPGSTGNAPPAPRSRRGGVLLHPSSLPGPGPIGELGPYAYAFLDWMDQAGLRVWQVLPLHPVGPGHSPYASPSAFAGDWRLVSVEELVRTGVLEPVALPWGTDRIDSAAIERWKEPLVREAGRRVSGSPACREWAARQSWLADWALYNALRRQTGGGWDGFGHPRPTAALRRANAAAIAEEEGVQFLFEQQWQALRREARERGIRLLGDMPLFVSGDGADTWCHRDLFHFRDGGTSAVADPVAGVPPDYFSPTGQRWGNPTYAWHRHEDERYAWWIARVRRELELVDELRIDHFRGLVANWAIAADQQDARRGAWAPGPGRTLFDALAAAIPGVLARIVAEDLGDITPDVVALREDLGLPGMKVLQFAFGGDWTHAFLPHNYVGTNWVAYTGTHDNDTALGWYEAAGDVVQHRFRVYTGRAGTDAVWGLLREAWASVADTAVAPMQDVLGLGSDARMNVPGEATGSWSWRMRDLPWDKCGMMRSLSEVYSRN